MPVYFYIMYILEVLALLQRRRVGVFEAACLKSPYFGNMQGCSFEKQFDISISLLHHGHKKVNYYILAMMTSNPCLSEIAGHWFKYVDSLKLLRVTFL